jgi:hypothetical protein
VGHTQSLVDSLRKLSGSAAASRTGRTWHVLRLAAIEERCQELLREEHTDPTGSPRRILLATAVGLGAILFLTVA